MATLRERSSAVCLHQGQMLLVELLDNVSGRHFWVPPGGLIEPGESPQEAAERETWEETRCRVQAREPKLVKTYPFIWLGEMYTTTTHFFMADLISEHKDPWQRPENYIVRQAWIPLDNAIVLLKVHEPIAEAILELMQNHGIDRPKSIP